MNYNQLDKYITQEQVYSKDLNQILSKTPPRLFRWTLTGIAVCMLLLLACGFIIRDKEILAVSFITLEKGPRNTIVSSIGEDDLKKILMSGKATIGFLDPQSGRNMDLQVVIDSFKVEPFFEWKGQAFASLEQLNQTVPDISKIKRMFRVYAYHQPGNKEFPTGGVVKFVVRDQTWIGRIFKKSKG